MAGLPPLLLFDVLRKTLQATGSVLPTMFIAFAGNGLNAALTYAFLWPMGMGYVGASWARTWANWFMFTALFLYAYSSGIWSSMRLTWDEDVFRGWKEYLSLAVPGLIGFIADCVSSTPPCYLSLCYLNNNAFSCAVSK
jgi:Na+-driven multidrug efflux pump